MQVIISLITFAIFIIFFIGLVNPKVVSKWFGRNLGRKQIFLSCLVCFFVLAMFGGGDTSEQKNIQKSVKNNVVVADGSVSEDVITESNSTSTITTELVEDSVAGYIEEKQVKVDVEETSNNEVQEVSKDEYTYYRVSRVVDGDTIELDNGQKVRYIGIDTPESVSTRQSVECFGIEASNKNKELVLGKMVRLEKDVSETDRYGRLLRYVYLQDGTFINKTLVEEGYASAYRYPPDVKYASLFNVTEQEARVNNRGLWNPDSCPTEIIDTEVIETSTDTAVNVSGHTWYTSSHYTAQYYYCDTDDGWKGLSPKNLKAFSSVEELLQNYPNRILHEGC